MTQPRKSILSSREDMGDAWELLCATGEFALTWFNVDKKYEAVLKLTKTFGKVAVKLIEPRQAAGDLAAQEQSENATEAVANAPSVVNIKPLLDSLKLRAVEIDIANLFEVLKDREFRTENNVVLSGTVGWTARPRTWLPKHWGRVSLLEDASLNLESRKSTGLYYALDFGSVRLGGGAAAVRELVVTSCSTQESGTNTVLEHLTDRRPSAEVVAVEMAYRADLRPALRTCGIRIHGAAKGVAGFQINIGLKSRPKEKFCHLLLLEPSK